MARQAAEQQRRQQIQDEQRRREQAIVLERRRQEAELDAQRRLEQRRREAQARAEEDHRAAQLRADEERQTAQEAAEAARQKAAKEAEDRKKAAIQLRPAAKQLVQDASEFLKTNPPQALQLVRQIATLNGALNETDPSKLRDLMQGLIAALREQPGYARFEEQKGEQSREEANRQLADLLKTAEQQNRFIKYYVTNNPTASQTLDLLPFVERIAAGISAPELETIKRLTGDAEIAIRKAGLSESFVRYKDVLTASSDTTRQGQVRRTAKNAILMDGGLNDFVLIYNSSRKAPHVHKNLRGEFDFDRNEAAACLYQAGFDRAEIFMLRRAIQKYGLRPGNISIDQAECNRSDLKGYDVIALTRGAFLRLNPELSLPLLAEMEDDSYKPLTVVSNEDIAKERREQDELRAKIKQDVEAGTADGFGIIISDQANSALCLVGGSSASAHRRWLDNSFDRLWAEANLQTVIEKSGVERAYEALQKGECGAVYGSAPELKQLADALKRDGGRYEVSALWANNADISSLQKELNEEQEKAAVSAAKRKQEVEGRRELARQEEEDHKNSAAARQQQMRAQYGKTATATAALIASEVRAGFEAGPDWQSTAAFKQFPRAISAFQNLRQSRWELLSFNSDVFDYGTADWKGRRLETSVAQVTARVRNRILGEYRDLCFLFGRINDAEFAMSREAVAVACDQPAQIADWKRAHQFSSSWNAE